MWAKRILLLLLLAVVLGAGGFLAWAWEPALPAAEPPDRAAFNRQRLERGAELAAIGNCYVCHTTEGGKAYAGGRPLPTPFGTIYATNITPDPDTGIGRWSEAAFTRALREGVDRAGRHLYPAFPYDHFTNLSDEDVGALYAFMMTREPVRAENPKNELTFPLDVRLSVAGWKLLFFRKGRAEPAADAASSRGAYLVQAVAHCGACHTPRNRLGAEDTRRPLAGGRAEGWNAPALDAASPAPVPWTADTLFTYLRSGFEPRHGAAAGPMAPIVRLLAQVPEEDVRAIAAAVIAVAGPPSPERQRTVDALLGRLSRADAGTVGLGADGKPSGNAIFAGACANCHSETRLRGAAGALNLALTSAINAPDPGNAIRVVLDGLHPGASGRGPSMPGFAGTLDDAQIAEVIAYARSRFSTQPAWSGLEARVRGIREGKEPF